MKTCADCGGMISIVNTETATRDGWERWECGNCHRHLSFVLAITVERSEDLPQPTIETPAVTIEEGKPKIEHIELPPEENQEDFE